MHNKESLLMKVSEMDVDKNSKDTLPYKTPLPQC